MGSFYFYDLETFGIDPKTTRVAQFAGIRTDENFNILSKDMFYCLPTGDSLPDPEASLITGITPQHCQKKGIHEFEFIQKILAEFAQPNTCVLGYNNIRFDDEFIRHTLYRNLLEPYGWSYKDGNSRFDLLDVVRFCYALKPDHSLQWVFKQADDGKSVPSFKLDQLAPANNIEHTKAHDALSDVVATIGIAKIIKQTQPQLFAYAFSLRHKQTVASLIKPLAPILHTSGMYPAVNACTKLTTAIAYHPQYKDRAIVYNLEQNPSILLDLEIDELKERLFTKQDKLAPGKDRLALKEIIFNKSPMFIASQKPPSGLKINTKLCLDNLTFIKKHHSQILKKVLALYEGQDFDSNTNDVDQMIYNGFIQTKDRAELDKIVQLNAKQLKDYHPKFTDKRLPNLLLYYKGRRYPDSLNEQEAETWFEIVQNRLQSGLNGYLSIEVYFEKISILSKHYPEKKSLWHALNQYGESLI